MPPKKYKKMPSKSNVGLGNLATIPESNIFPEMKQIFATVQKSSTCHEKCIKMMQDIFDKVEFDCFTKHFINCLLVPLQVGLKSSNVDLTLDFAGKFCATFSQDCSDDSIETEMHPFLLYIFNWLIKYCDCDLPAVRYRICQFINKVLVFMGENAELDDQLCDDILQAMLARLQDIKYKVRTQAVVALHRLQNPSDPNDRVTKAYLFHLSCDPKAPVRRAVINNLARSIKAFAPVNTHTKDIDEKVRRDAYNFMSMYSSKMFKIQQRIQILENGLNDRSNNVKMCVSEVLLPKWFVHFDRNYFEFIKGITLDVSKEDLKQSIKVAEQMLNVFFNKDPARDLIGYLPMIETKVLNPERLNHETVTYWRCLAQFFYKQSDQAQDYLDELIPELSVFCSYIQTYVQSVRKKTRDEWEELVHQSILHQLFEMCNFFDLSDEVGRSNLISLINELLLKERLHSEVIKTMVHILEKLKPDAKRRFLELVEMISDITDPLQEQETEEAEMSIIEGIQRRRNVKIHELRFKLNVLLSDEEAAVADKRYLEAENLKEEINETRKKLAELTEALVPVQKSPAEKKLDDESNIKKSLDIIIAMLQSKSIKTFPTELRILQQNFILDLCNQSSHPPEIEAKALTSLAMCAYLDENLALSVMPKLIYRLLTYKFNGSISEQVVLVSLSAVFDLLLLYGLSKFPDAEDNAQNNRTNKRTLYDNTQDDDDDEIDIDAIVNNQSLPSLNLCASFNEILCCALSFLDDDNSKVRTRAADGLCRLLITDKLKSTEVLTRLLILWCNPATENDGEMRQIIGLSINHFAQNVSGAQEEIVKAFLPTINTLLDAPANSPLKQVEIDGFINFLLVHTQPGFSSIDTSVNVHNQLAIMICEEILKGNRESGYYVKCLPCLKVSDDDPLLKKDLYNLCTQILAELKSKAYARYINKFVRIIMDETGVTETTNQETEIVNGTEQTVSEKTAQDSVPTNETENTPVNNKDTPRSKILSSKRRPIIQLNRMDTDCVTPLNSRSVGRPSNQIARSARLKQLLADNEDNVSIAGSSASSTRSSKRISNRCSQNVVISESDSDDETSSDESDTPQLSPIRRKSQRSVHRPSRISL